MHIYGSPFRTLGTINAYLCIYVLKQAHKVVCFKHILCFKHKLKICRKHGPHLSYNKYDTCVINILR